MSRIGKMPIPVGDKVKIDIAANNVVTVKGPKGELVVPVDPEIQVAVQDGELIVSRPTEQKRHKALHGLYRALLNSAVVGVTDGYKRELEVIGVGYRAEVAGGVLQLALGYSHPIYFMPPRGVQLSVIMDPKRSKNPIIAVEGIDKQMVGQVAAKIRALRPPEPYKGKGVRYVDEFIRRKAGKTAAR